MHCSTPGFPVHHQFPELVQTHAHGVSDAIQTSHPLLSPSAPAFNLSQHQGLFQRVNFSHEVAKVLEFQLSIIPSKEHPGLISFRMDWLDLLAVQETLKSLLQHHSSKASILWRSAFFTVQLSRPYMTTRKTIALTRWTFVGQVMSLLWNMLSSLVLTFLPRSKRLLISWLHSPSSACFFSATGGHSEKAAICKPRGGLLADSASASSLILNLSTSRTVENKCLLFKSLSLWCC